MKRYEVTENKMNADTLRAMKDRIGKTGVHIDGVISMSKRVALDLGMDEEKAANYWSGLDPQTMLHFHIKKGKMILL